jgi:predicted MFS family arabinose efflux permease
MDQDLHFSGNQYSLLILLFHVPFGIMDLPLTLLTKRFSGKKMLLVLIVGWGSMATIC